MSDTKLELRENAVRLAAEFLHEFLCRKADIAPFFDNLKPEARKDYFREAARFVDRITNQVEEPG